MWWPSQIWADVEQAYFNDVCWTLCYCCRKSHGGDPRTCTKRLEGEQFQIQIHDRDRTLGFYQRWHLQAMYEIVSSFRPRFENQFRSSSEYYILHRRLNAAITDSRLENYSQHSLEELPLLLFGAVIKGTRYTAIYYPVFPQAGSDATDPNIGYISPIEDLAKSYCEDTEFLAAARQHLDINPRSGFNRVFFSKSDYIGSTGMSAKNEKAVLASTEEIVPPIPIANWSWEWHWKRNCPDVYWPLRRICTSEISIR